MSSFLKAEKISAQFSRGKTYLLSNNGTFLFRFVDSAFGSKWCGLWDMQTKLLEYFAFKVDGEWLSPYNFDSFEFTGTKAIHKYRTHIGEVSEEVVVGNGELGVILRIPKMAKVEAEVGVNIRKREENLHGRGYEIISRESSVTVSNSLGRVTLEMKDGKFIPSPVREKHFPGRYATEFGYDWVEEEQEKFIPGKFTAMGKMIEFIATTNGNEINKWVRRRVRRVREKAKKIKSELAWKIANALEDFYFERGNFAGFFAGYPYFNEFWTRDFLYMVEPLLHAGFEREVVKALKTIAREQREDGAVPMIVPGDEDSADSTPLFLLAVKTCYEFFGNAVINQFMKNVIDAIEYGVEHYEDGLVEHNATRTWMDTLHRKNAIEVEAFWAKAFLEWGKTLKRPNLTFLGNKIRDSLVELYFRNGFFLDSLESRYKFTVNSLIPFTLDIVRNSNPAETLRKAKEELLCGFGVRAVSRREGGEEYHERVWGISTYFGLKFLRKYDKKAFDILLNNYLRMFGARTINGMAETFTEDGIARGATHQLWSIAYIPEMMEVKR